MPSKPQTDRLRQALADEIIEAMLPFVKGWVKTLGLAGSPGNKGVTASTRVTAAKTGIELVTKFMASGSSPAGEGLLKKIEALRANPASTTDDDTDDTNGAARGDWVDDPVMGDEEPDLEPGPGPHSGD